MAKHSSSLLTDAAVRKLKPDPKGNRVIRDLGARALHLVIAPSGSKSWLMRFRRPSGKLGKMVIGPLDLSGHEMKEAPIVGMPLTLSGARALAATIHRERALGHDVIGDHKVRRHRQRVEIEERGANSFAACVRQFVQEYLRPKTRQWQWRARMLGLQPENLEPIPGSLVVRWGDRLVSAIDAHDIWAAIDEAQRFGIPGCTVHNPNLSEARGRHLLAILSKFFSWLKEHRRVASNPCSGIKRPSPSKPGERVLSADELRWFWLGCDAAGELFAFIFRLLLLTGQRLNEVAGMRRAELRDDGMWHLPGSRTKNHKAHVVPLPPLAHEIIANVPVRTESIFALAGRTTPPSNWSLAKGKVDAAMLAAARAERGSDAVIPAFKIHDLRRTVVTGMVELGISIDVVERVVNHSSGTRSGVAGTYNRSELLPERRAALERWAAHIEWIVSSAATEKIVPLRGGR